MSQRDSEILRLLANGQILAEIGRELSVSYKMVANVCTHIKAKLGVSAPATTVLSPPAVASCSSTADSTPTSPAPAFSTEPFRVVA